MPLKYPQKIHLDNSVLPMYISDTKTQYESE